MKFNVAVCFVLSMPAICTAILTFRNQSTTYKLSEMLAIGTVVDNITVYNTSNKLSIVSYDIKAGNDNNTFGVDNNTGIITLAKNLDRENQEIFHLIKMAKSGISSATVTLTITVLDENDNPPVCPQKLTADVREVAPLGEVALSLDCKDADKTPNSDSTYKRVNLPRKGRKYFPFKISEFGNVVVTKPIVYRNNSINSFNFTIEVQNKKLLHTGTGNGTTHVNVTINIIQTGCNVKWSYQETQNMYLKQPLYRLKLKTGLSLDECKTECSSESNCHTIEYDRNTKKCVLTAETVFTHPDAFSAKPGHSLYRKFCDIEPLPSPSLRILKSKFNTSVGVQSAISTALILHRFLDPGGDKTSTDTWTAADILFAVVKNTHSNRRQEGYVVNLIEIINECVSKLLETYHRTLWKAGQKFGRQPVALIDTVEVITKIASRQITQNLQVSAKHSALYSYNNTYQFVNIPLLKNGSSGVFIPDQGFLNMKLAVGVIDRLDDLIKTGLPNNSTKKSIKTQRLLGHILSVNTNLPENSTYQPPVLLDIESRENISEEGTTRKCVFFHRGFRNNWKTDGCRVVWNNKTHTRCECNHLTNFAILMQVQDFNTSSVIQKSLETLTLIGCSASIAALTLTMATLLILKLKSDRYILLMNLSVSLILAQITFLTGIHATDNHEICRLVAVLLHYLYLSVFTLMLAEGIQMYNKIYRPLAKDINFFLYLGLGWGAPVVIVGISLATDHEGYGTNDFCWLSSTRGTIWSFVGPALTVITINTVILVMVIRTFLGVRVIARRSERDRYKSGVKAAAVLLPLLGVTWTFGVLAINADTVVFQYVFALLNSAQGIFILLFHIVLNDDVKLAIRRKQKRKIVNVHAASHTDITCVNQGQRVNSNHSQIKEGTTAI